MILSNKKTLRFSSRALLIASIFGITTFGCSDDESPGDGDGDGDTQGDGDGDTQGDGDGDGDTQGDGDGDTQGDGDGDGGAGGQPGDGDGDGDETCESWGDAIDDPDIELSSPVPAVVSAWVGEAGVLAAASDIRASGSIDSGDWLTFDGDFTIAGYNGATYIGHQEKSIIEKYEVQNGQLELVGTVNFQTWGVTDTDSGSRFVIKFVDDETALFFDHSLAKAFKFNPTDMTATGANIDYSELFEDLDLSADDWADVRDVGTLGDKFIVPMYNWRGEEMLPWTRVAIVDPSDDSVVVAEDDRCSGSNRMTYDLDGNVYFGPHSASALETAQMEDHPGPCVLRLNVGATELDSDYFLALSDIAPETDDGVAVLTGGYQGAGGLSYFLGFSGDLSLGPAARWEDAWTAYAVDLSSECPELKEVDGWPLGNSEPRDFSLMVDGEKVHFIAVTSNESGNSYLSANPDGSVTEQLSLDVWPNIAVPQ